MAHHPTEVTALQFPALLIADDGWVGYLENPADLSTFNQFAIRKYNKRRVVLLDSSDSAWLITRIVPLRTTNFFMHTVARILNSRSLVRIEVEPITDAPLESVRRALNAAIDADDDVLTQQAEPEELRQAVHTAHSFDALVAALKERGAI